MKRPIRHHRNHKRRHVAPNHVSETRLLVDLVDDHATLFRKLQLLRFHVLQKRVKPTLLFDDGLVTEGGKNERFDLRFFPFGPPRNRLRLPESTGDEEERTNFVRRMTTGEVVATSSSSSVVSASASESSGTTSEERTD